MAEGVSFETAAERIEEGAAAGTEYIENLESIRDELTVQDGSTLGTMVSAQLKMTETETEYMVKSGLPKKASSTNMQAAQDVKKAAG
jgi:hypothetical protein